MAVHKLYNASVVINSVDLSDHVKSVSIDTGAEALDDTNMGDTTKSNLGGLLTWGITVQFMQDYAPGKVDATLNGLVGSTTTIVVKADAGSVSTTNPSWTGTGLLTAYNPVGGQVGELHMTQATFASAGTLTRATA
jgi:hypothetical protein